MNLDKESKSRTEKKIGGGGGGGGVGGRADMCTKAAIYFYARHIVTTSSTEPYGIMKIFPTVFKIEGIVALTIKGR